jgi:hypothetical protein
MTRQPGVAEAFWDVTRADDDRAAVRSSLGRIGQPCLVVVGRADRWATAGVPGDGHPDRSLADTTQAHSPARVAVAA